METTMKRFVKTAFFAAALIAVSSVSGFAWDDVGHKVTGYIAWQRMSPAARENVIKILRAAPEDSHLSAFYMNYGPQSDDARKMEYFVMVPTWADIVRDRSFANRYAKYHKGNWHYSDNFWRQVDGKVQLITDRKGDGLGTVKLVEMDAIMRDANAKPADKAIAIAWFLHIGGDLHQPLHTSGRHTDREPEGDRGGNLFLVAPEDAKGDERVNIHWFWDSIVGRNVPMIAGQCEEDYIRSLAESMMLKYPFDVRSGLNLGRYPEWQQETFALANTEVFRPDLVRFQTPSDEYRRNAFQVTEQRLAMAGYRMGETLNEIFGK